MSNPVESTLIVIVDDDVNVCELVALYLEREGFTVQAIHDGAEALRQIRALRPHLVILDLMLPGMDGTEICRRLRQESDVPVIMLTAKGDDIDRILGLELGADDYVPKPFNPRELVARVKAVLRRARPFGGRGAGELQADARNRSRLVHPGLEIDRDAHTVRVGGEQVALTPKEFDLLWHLASHPDRTFTRPELLESVWGFDYFGDDRTVDVHIKRLRRKIELPSHPFRYVQTVWGVGYKFHVEEHRSG